MCMRKKGHMNARARAHTHTHTHTHTYKPINNKYGLDDLGFEFRLGQENFFVRKPSRTARVST